MVDGESLKRVCPVCHKEFTPRRKDQKRCSQRCSKIWLKHHQTIHREPEPGVPIIREFYCRWCHRLVQIADPEDRRTVFCCQKHEKDYWRHGYTLSDHGRGGNLGLSGGMSLGGLMRRERRDLD
jgi:endogenous inhibitor of DNA gyrase (YacG/DUF329 family)